MFIPSEVTTLYPLELSSDVSLSSTNLADKFLTAPAQVLQIDTSTAIFL